MEEEIVIKILDIGNKWISCDLFSKVERRGSGGNWEVILKG